VDNFAFRFEHDLLVANSGATLIVVIRWVGDGMVATTAGPWTTLHSFQAPLTGRQLQYDGDCSDSVGREMEQQLKRAEHYRQQANRYANLGKTGEPDFLRAFFRKIAVRYVLMAEDLERWTERSPGRRRNDLSTSINERADAFLRAS
jgi:hypothetical protein